MRWLLFALLLGCHSLALAAPANANPFGNSQSIPRVEQAMPFNVVQDAQRLDIRFTLLDDVYLYRPQLKLIPLGLDNQTLDFDFWSLVPSGTPHEDDIYGKTEVFFNELTLSVPLEQLPDGTTAIRLGYQGCLENILCYPPQDSLITLDYPRLSTVTNKAGATNAVTAPLSLQATADDSSLFDVLKSADANRFAHWANAQSLGYVLLLFFVGGLLMAFTPCVFPMIPILLGILAGTRNPTPAKGFMVSLAYVLGMAVPYTLAGLLVALTGAKFNLHLWLQQPWVIVVAALVFVLLSLAMFGLFEMQMPARLRQQLGGTNPNGSLTQAAVLGGISSLIVSPCITPVLAGSLLFVAAQGNALTGTLALFTLSLGMGIPLLIIGAGGSHLLPKAGNFMEDIKRLFGLILLLMAIWLAGRLLPAPATLALYGAVLFIYALLQGATDRSHPFRQALALLVLFYASLLMIGALAGAQSPLKPLAPFTGAAQSATAHQHTSAFTSIDKTQLADVLQQAAASRQPVLVDFYADWCVSCKEFEDTTLSDPAVLSAMTQISLLRIDLSKVDKVTRDIMQQHQVLGLPALLFFDRSGNEISKARVLGYMNSEQWLSNLHSHVLPAIE